MRALTRARAHPDAAGPGAMCSPRGVIALLPDPAADSDQTVGMSLTTCRVSGVECLNYSPHENAARPVHKSRTRLGKPATRRLKLARVRSVSAPRRSASAHEAGCALSRFRRAGAGRLVSTGWRGVTALGLWGSLAFKQSPSETESGRRLAGGAPHDSIMGASASTGPSHPAVGVQVRVIRP